MVSLTFHGGVNRKKTRKPNVDAVLISHAHADHVDYASFLHEDIPLYMGQTTQNMIKASLFCI